jgi:ubiquinone/menaquinone biosynthesis C-methylase UbiE
LSDFWNELVKRLGPREDVVIIPGAPSITNMYVDRLQRKALICQLSFFTGNTILDIGCGIGRWARLLTDKANQVIGIDISKEMIKIAKQRIKNPNVHFIVASVHAIPLHSKSVDFSLSCTCLQHICEEDKQKKGIQEITRVTKSRILILELMSKAKKIKLTHYPTLITPKSEYVEALRKFGAKEIKEIGVDFLPLVKLIEDLRNLILTKLGVNVPSYGGSLKQRLMRGSYQILSVFALAFSLPLNKLIKNPPSNLTRHVLLVAEMK